MNWTLIILTIIALLAFGVIEIASPEETEATGVWFSVKDPMRNESLQGAIGTGFSLIERFKG